MSEWIKCSEKIPENDGRYLVNVPYSDHSYVSISLFKNNRWYDRNVTHWMPLPSTPEKE